MEAYTQEILIGLGGLVIILIALVIHFEIRLRKLLRGTRAKSIEDSLSLIEQDIKVLKNFKGEASAYLEKVEKRLGRSIQGVGMIRFNPFKGNGEGGNQSFASSLITEKGDGLIISSLYSRDHVSIFAKPVKNYTSEFELTEEEKESLSRARACASPKEK